MAIGIDVLGPATEAIGFGARRIRGLIGLARLIRIVRIIRVVRVVRVIAATTTVGRSTIGGRRSRRLRVRSRLIFLGSEQRVAACTSRARHALGVHEDRRTGGDHRVVAVRLAVLEPEHLHVEVLQRVHRGEAAQVRRELVVGDTLNGRPSLATILVIGEEANHGFHVADVLAASAVGATGVQAGGIALHFAVRQRCDVGHLICREFEGGGERIGPDHARRLEERPAGALGISAVVATTTSGGHDQKSGEKR